MSEELQGGQDKQGLIEELDRLRFLLDVSPQVRWTGNSGGEITWVSEQWVALTGHPREAALGLGWVEFLHPDDVLANDQAVRRAIETKSAYDMEYRVRHAEGTYRWMRGRAVPRTDHNKGETLWYGMTEDIHDRKTAEAEVTKALQSLQVTQESLSLAMKGGRMGWWTRDLRTDVVIWSPELEAIFGFPPHGFTGTRRDFLSHVHPDDLADFKNAVEKALASKTEYAVVFRFRREDGREGWMEGRGLAVYDSEGRPIASYGVGIDITEQRRMQEISAGQYRQVAEGLPQLVWSALSNGERDYYNQRWFDYTGPMAGLSISELWSNTVHPDDRAQALQRWQQSVRTGETFQAEYRLRRHDGEYRWFLGRAMPIRDEQEQIVRWFGTCTDIHDQKSTEHVLAVSNEFAKTLSADLDLDRIVQALTDACTQAIGAQFGSFFYSVVNEEGEALLLYTLSGAPIEAFEKFGLPRPTKVFGPTFRNEGIVRSDDITKDPRYGSMGPHFGMPKGHLPVVSYLAISVVSRSGEVIGGLFFGHSKPGMFTEEHERIVSSFAAQAAVAIDNARLYASVTSMKETLERQVAERTADLQSSNDALQGFTYHVAHDLRSPLRTIVSTSRIVQEDFGDHLPAEAAELLERQALAAGRLGRLIDDLLRMARLTREEARRDRVDVTQMGHEVAVEALEAHPQSQVAVEVQDGLVAQADPRLFRLALGNLVENAVKYSPSGGTVRLGRREDGAFFVSDEGIGIDPRYFTKVFEPFQRLHRDDEFSGTGIGLSNVQQIIARHGGRVWVESELGKGSTFYFTLE